ncbi:MAG TPA: hypothetical protein VMI56_27595 [Reyranella sp.]|nr:hypothetical protein [Reyranella sp.]
MSLKKIRLEMARTREFPDGNSHCGYEFTAPLDRQGHLDEAGWRHDKERCTVRRFWDNADDEHGLLRHHGGRWVFSYGPVDDEEPIFRFDKHMFTPGEYVTVTEHDGRSYPFRIVSVREANATEAV